jgi:signal transduction histidine kinase
MEVDLVGDVAHELRTPLTAILGYVEELRTGDPDPLTELQQQYLEIVERNAQRLLALVDDFVFIEEPWLDKSVVDLAQLAGAEGSVAVEGDAARLDQLVQSLVAATDAAKVTVHSEAAEAVLEVAGSPPHETAGTRFALALSRAIAEAHGGALERDGGTFRVRLPLASS